MEVFTAIAAVMSTAAVILSVIALILILKKNNGADSEEVANAVIPAVRQELYTQMSAQRQELSAQTQTSVKNMGDMLLENQRESSRQQEDRLARLERRMNDLSLTTEHHAVSIIVHLHTVHEL